ncbi:MAG: SIS domain-containing protein [Clostridium sp.]|nr:SIS domain-containing protein [Clostridium sp.]
MRKNIFKRKKEEVIIKPPSLDHFPDFTKKEIFTQGELIEELLDRYIKADKIDFDYLKIKLDKIKRIYIVGKGSDYSCAVFGAYNFEVLLDIVTVPVCTGEFLCSNPILDKNTLVIIIGDDTEAVERVKNAQCKLISILDYSDSSNALTLNYKTLGQFDTAAYTMKLVALSLLALYFGEKEHVVTELYIRIAIGMLKNLKEKIKYILSQEFILGETARLLPRDKLIITGTNVDYAVSIYGSYIMSTAKKAEVSYAPLSQLTVSQKEKYSIIALASNIDFYSLLDSSLDYQVKIVPSGVNCEEDKTLFYKESIPLFNPILSSVVLQILTYKL